MIIKNIWNHHLEYSFFDVPKNQGATGRWFPTLSECRLETQRTFLLRCKALSARFSAYGQLGVPLTYVYPWYLLCSLGILGDYNPQIPLYRAYIGISHRGTLVGVRPTIPWEIRMNPMIETIIVMHISRVPGWNMAISDMCRVHTGILSTYPDTTTPRSWWLTGDRGYRGYL